MVIILSVVFMYSWFFGALRFQWEPASIIYSILNIPFGFLYLILEKYLLNVYGYSHWINDEIASTVIWMLSVVIQAILYFYVIKKLFKNKQAKTDHPSIS